MLLKSRRSKAGIALALGTALTLLLAGTAGAATIPVNSSADPTDGSNCTLRQAIANADANGQPNATCAAGDGDDTITFASSLLGATIDLNGELLVNPSATGTLDIQGPGAVLLEVSGGNTSRVFHIAASAFPTANKVTIERLKISNGSVTNGDGGGILNQGSLALDRDYVWDNTASRISNGGTTNQATALGGGVESTGGFLSVTLTQVAGNTVTATASAGSTSNTATARGAGIHASGDFTGILQIGQSSIYNNAAVASATGTGAQASAEGGGVWSSAGAQTSILSSTIASNTLNATGTTAQERGGGVLTNITAMGAFAASVIDDTVTGNDAATSGANLAKTAGTMNMRNTIAADPAGTTNCLGVTSLGYSIASDATCGLGANGDLPSTNPDLLDLDLYGGTGPTRPPDVGSPAIDAGFSDNTTDQRGLTMPWDFINVAEPTGGDGSDIGSVEIQGPFVSATDPDSPSSNQQPNVIGGAEDGSTIELHATADCSDTPLGNGTVANFALPGIAPTSPLAPGSTTTFHAQSLYGTARSACSPSSVDYTVLQGSTPTPPPPAPTQPATKKKCKKKAKKHSASAAKKKKCKKRKK